MVNTKKIIDIHKIHHKIKKEVGCIERREDEKKIGWVDIEYVCVPNESKIFRYNLQKNTTWSKFQYKQVRQ